jgi:SAM-dependent methyltransferase
MTLPPHAAKESGPTPYSANFFAVQQGGSVESAEVIVPLVLSLFDVRSVVDVGCGVGGWLHTFERNGISDYLGIDGDYVPTDMLKIPAANFRARDLTRLVDIGRSFDLACSLEVAEHLPQRCADSFVAALTECAPVILFSAAIPRQGGTAHINEQWASYWAAKFERRGYMAVDCIRPSIYGNQQVAWWYRQNAIVFCRPERCPATHERVRSLYDLDRIDPSMIEHLFVPESGTEAVRTISRALPVLGTAILRRLNLR